MYHSWFYFNNAPTALTFLLPHNNPIVGHAYGVRSSTLRLFARLPQPPSHPPIAVRYGFKMNRTGAQATTMTEMETPIILIWGHRPHSSTLTTWPRQQPMGEGVVVEGVTTSITWTQTPPPSQMSHKRWKISLISLRSVDTVMLQVSSWVYFLFPSENGWTSQITIIVIT